MPERKEDKLKQYFIALVPPSPLSDDALRLKSYFKEQYNSKASLNSPAHLTLHMPFKWKEDREDELTAALTRFALRRETFKLEFNNFNAFIPRVIFIDVAPNDLLVQLNRDLHRFCKRELNLFNADYKNLPFHPHLTLAFRDLKKPMFEKAWDEFQKRKFTGRFDVDRISLLKHNGKIWEVKKDFLFDPSAQVNDEKANLFEFHH